MPFFSEKHYYCGKSKPNPFFWNGFFMRNYFRQTMKRHRWLNKDDLILIILLYLLPFAEVPNNTFWFGSTIKNFSQRESFEDENPRISSTGRMQAIILWNC